jgi:hypothetical protein
MPIATFSRRAIFSDDTFGAVALVGTNIVVFTAILRPPDRRHAVLRFRAVGRLRWIHVPWPPPSNVPLPWERWWGELQSLPRVLPPFLLI